MSARAAAGGALAALVGGLLLASCAAKESKPGEGAGAQAKSLGSPKTLVWGMAVQPDLLNPLLSTSASAREINDLVFLRLTEIGPPPAHDPEPLLATSWELSGDGLELRYRLRPDVTWEDGMRVTARDVAFTFQRMADPGVAYPNKTTIRKIAACEAIGDSIALFRFHERSAEPITETRFHVLPAHLLEGTPIPELATCAFNRAPVGDGRWRVREWTHDERIVIEARDDTPLGRPHFDRIVFRIVPEDNTMRSDLLSGGVDVVHRYPNRFLREDERNPALTFLRIPDRTYTYVGWNLKNPLFQDLRVRTALTLAIDRRTIVDAFRDGYGEVVAVPLYPEHPDFHPKIEPLPFDPARAAALLDEAGWKAKGADGVRVKDGRRFELTLLLISGNTISEEIATLMQEEYAKLGIVVKSQAYEMTVYLDKLHAKDFEATILARRVEFVYDPESVFHSRAIEGQYNDVSFASPTIDALIDRAKSIPDRGQRRQVWWEFQEAFARELPITVLYVGNALYPVRKDAVQDPVMDARGALVRVHEWHPAGGAS
jgi:peptide/nickel transport system substrate-binding protein